MKGKIVLKVSLRALLSIAVFLMLYTIALFILPKIRFESDKSQSDITKMQCFLKSNGAHVDIVMPIKSDNHDWSTILSQEHIRFSDSTFNWIAFGWGDKNFFLNTPTWDDLTFSTAFKAAFWLSSGAMHVTYYKDVYSNETCLPFELSAEQTQQLFSFILQDFEHDDDGKIVHIPTDKVYGSRDAFYSSTKKYSLFHTCNTWVNNAMKSSNHKHCLWTALEFGVMDLLR